MIVVRDVFHCKYGMAGALVKLMGEAQDMMPAGSHGRLLTDRSGKFDTVVAEWVMEDMATWERQMQEEYSNPAFTDWFRRMQELVDSGSREFFYIEMES